MKLIKILLFLFIGILFISCDDTQLFNTDKFELRQLLNKEQVSQNTHGAYFLIVGEYSSETEYNDIVKVCAKVNNQYRFLQFNIKKVRIEIDNNLTKPQIQYFYKDWGQLSNERIFEYERNQDYIVIYCPEQYLPEKLLPIELK